MASEAEPPKEEPAAEAVPAPAATAESSGSADGAAALKVAELRKRKREAKAADEAAAKAAKKAAPLLVVLGLGNKGQEPEVRHRLLKKGPLPTPPDPMQTRHNLGARVVKELAGRLTTTQVPDKEGLADALQLECSGRPKLLLPPQGHINSSGQQLKAALAALEQPEGAFLLVVDDCSLPLGTIRFRAKGSSGGHNGLRDVEAVFGDGYHRLKLGIGGQASKDWVVGSFAPGAEAQTAQLVVERAAKAVEHWLELGPEEVQKVMALVNAPDFRQVSLPEKAAAGEEQAASTAG